MNDTKFKECETLHANYVRLSGRLKPWRMDCVFPWEAWTCRGWGLADLELVINYIKQKIQRHERKPESLKFSYIVCDLDRFEDDLCEAKAARGLRDKKAMVRATPNRDEALNGTAHGIWKAADPPAKVVTPALIIRDRTVAELVAAMRKAL